MRTPFYDIHQLLGAKMLDFHGWEMPLQYTGIIDEHINTRKNVCLFDVSHMGRFRIKGQNALDCLHLLVTNDVSRLADNHALYSPMCYENGGIIDDLIIYRINHEEFVMVVNASNREKDLAWITEHCKSRADIEDISDNTCLLAIQGPNSQNIMQRAAQHVNISGLKTFSFVITKIFGTECLLSRTGYTGEDGFEILFDSSKIELWNKLINLGSQFSIKPAGLGARDTLRIESGLMLYGNDIDENVSPMEVPLKWTVKLEGHDFMGKKALETRLVERKLVGFEIPQKRIARHGNEVFSIKDQKIGFVTSGTFSPTLNQSIGFCFVPIQTSSDELIHINVGGKPYEAKIKSTIKFYRRA
jgi:glycine cleavage system T protein (aminomethyltransferase)